MPHQLEGRKVAILATDGVEQSELTEARRALEQAGTQVVLVSLRRGSIQGFSGPDRGESFGVDRTIAEAKASEYDALVLPGGLANPDALRTDPQAVRFVREFFAARKPVAAICHGPWMLVEADAVRHRSLTSWPSLRTDILNAGGNWVDEPVHVDQGLVTSRKPDDLPAFCARMIEEFAEGVHEPGWGGSPEGDLEASRTGDEDAATDLSVAGSFPASDPPSSRKVT
jgi:protease I